MAQTSQQGYKHSGTMPGTQPPGLRLHHCWCCAGQFYLAMCLKIVHIPQKLAYGSGVCLRVSAPILRFVCDTRCRVVAGRGENVA